MIWRSAQRLSEKIMRKQQSKARLRFDLSRRAFGVANPMSLGGLDLPHDRASVTRYLKRLEGMHGKPYLGDYCR
jgi:hypothetical protein